MASRSEGLVLHACGAVLAGETNPGPRACFALLMGNPCASPRENGHVSGWLARSRSRAAAAAAAASR